MATVMLPGSPGTALPEAPVTRAPAEPSPSPSAPSPSAPSSGEPPLAAWVADRTGRLVLRWAAAG